MCLVVNSLLLFAVFNCFVAYSMNAEICLQDFMIDTVMHCRNCTGDLKVVFAPNRPVPYYSGDRIRDLNCTVNKPANVSIFFENSLKPYNTKPLELTKDGKVKGVTVARLNGGCTYQIHFDENSKSLCQYGKFTCKAVTNANEAISSIEVFMTETNNPPMTFTVEDDALQKSKELILGTYANLSCSYKSLEWNKVTFFSRPFIKFLRLDEDGNAMEIKDSPEKPPNYENEGKIEIRKPSGETPIGTRKLFLRRIDASAAATYFCRVQTTHGCHLEKKLVLTTRPCMAGHYCNQNSSEELRCREGTYSSINGSFSVSNCRICPINSYCPSGSAFPKQCPMKYFSPAKFTKVKLFQGKGKEGDCMICPVDPCDKEGSKCSFICSEGHFKGVLGQPITVRCALSNGKLLRNLTWFRGQKKIVNSSSYEVFREDKAFVLKIHKVSQGDSGDYNCSGFDVIMGNYFYSTINLVATDPGRSSENVLKLSLSLSFAFLFLVVIGVMVQRYLRRSRHEGSACGDKSNEMVTPIVEEMFCRDNRALFGGNPCKYDVFICYSSNDKTWVRGTLLPKLKSFELQVCIDFEDFSPGRYIIENVADAIYSSRKTVAVLSPDFLNSAWCHKELMMALTRVSNEHKVIPVMYRECQVPVFLCEVTYLDWCNEDVRQTFWDQLLRTINNGNYLEMRDVAGSTADL